LFTCNISKNFIKDLKKIDSSNNKSIRDALEKITDDPYKYSDIILNPNLPDRKTRVGVYRILFDIDKRNKIVNILSVKHRKDVYEKK
jgi:mRNA-degrading endonuclease RelE of RelBE toxin-antitoxin system